MNGSAGASPSRWRSAEELAVACGGEGVLDVFDGWGTLAVGPEQRDHVEAGPVFEQAVGFEVGQGGAGHSLLARWSTASAGVPASLEVRVLTSTNDDRAAVGGAIVDGDDVELADV